jgi:hypothetical protein
MIQTFMVTAPLGQVDGDGATATLTAAMARVRHLHPALRAGSVAACDGELRMQLRVAGRTRWHSSGDARKIASSMLHRAGIDVSMARMELMQTAPSTVHLTKEQGRSVTPRGPKETGG